MDSETECGPSAHTEWTVWACGPSLSLGVPAQALSFPRHPNAPVTNATLVAITSSDCATIDATLASTIAPSRRPARAGPTWDRHHRLHRRFSRPIAATAVTPVAAIAPATILAATAGAAERCDVWEGLSALSPPV